MNGLGYLFYSSLPSIFSFRISHSFIVRTHVLSFSPISTCESVIFTAGQHEPSLHNVTIFIVLTSISLVMLGFIIPNC